MGENVLEFLPFDRILTLVYRDAMDKLGCKRFCCRRMIMTHVDLIEKLLKSVCSHSSKTCELKLRLDTIPPSELD